MFLQKNSENEKNNNNSNKILYLNTTNPPKKFIPPNQLYIKINNILEKNKYNLKDYKNY